MDQEAKYFCISFHKTGTRSFHEFLKASGCSSLHLPTVVDGVDYRREVFHVRKNPKAVLERLQPVIESASAHSDVPWPGLYREISVHYPSAKFVLIRRDPTEWFNSLSKHWSLPLVKHTLTPFEAVQYWPYVGDEIDRLFTIRNRNLFIDAFNRHQRAVREELPPERLLIFDLGDPDAGRKIASFASLSSGVSFPRIGARRKKFHSTQYRRNLRWRYRSILESRFPRLAELIH
jgi:hypothetical protein